MNYILLPSLQEAAVVRIASLLYSDCEIENAFRYEKNAHRRRKIAAMKAEEKLSSLLPSALREKVGKVIYPMFKEVRSWKMDHTFLLEDVSGCCCTHLCWRTNGTINRAEAAKKLITIEETDPKIRFIFACRYYLEDEVTALWEKYEEIKKNKVFLHDTNYAVRFWMEWLEKKDFKPWSEMIDEYFRNLSFNSRNIPPRVGSFYHLLSRESKRNIDLSSCFKYHTDDFQMCVNKMNETERIKIFHSSSYTALHLCLKWPFRSLFLRMANEVIGYLTAGQFVLLLHGMLHEYLYDGDEDFEVFETFWQISPAALKDEARTNESIIRRINRCLADKNLPRDFKKTLRKCLN